MDLVQKSQRSRIVRVYRQGTPSELKLEEMILDAPGYGEVQLRHAAIGMNYIDTHLRSGRYAVSALPYVAGVEAAGVIEAVGPGVSGFKVGDRAGYHFTPGAYSDVRVIAAQNLVHIPDDVPLEYAASLLAKGMTVRMLIRDIRPISAGDIVLIHAAAGAVGSLLSRWAKALDARVYGTVGSPAKLNYARQACLDGVWTLENPDFAKLITDLTSGWRGRGL